MFYDQITKSVVDEEKAYHHHSRGKEGQIPEVGSHLVQQGWCMEVVHEEEEKTNSSGDDGDAQGLCSGSSDSISSGDGGGGGGGREGTCVDPRPTQQQQQQPVLLGLEAAPLSIRRVAERAAKARMGMLKNF